MWILVGMGTVMLLVAAINKKKSECCAAVDIHISGVQNNFFIDKNDINNILRNYSDTRLKGRPVSDFRLSAMENALQKNSWIRRAELYFDNNNVLVVNITEREPVARIFCSDGSSFYIDTARLRLPLSDKFSARVPVFTNFPTTNIVLSKEDSNLLSGIRTLGEYIANDPFWMAQIEQVDITPARTFEMIPKIGQQVILFGDGDNCVDKFKNLLLFYRQVESKTGWNKYSKINVQYSGQVIAEKRGEQEIKMDSLRTIQLMKLLVADALKQASDTLHTIQLVQPPEENNIPNPLIEDNNN
jgi:cell division protein FtsQ